MGDAFSGTRVDPEIENFFGGEQRKRSPRQFQFF